MLAFLDTAFSVFFAIIAAFTLERLQVKGRKFIKILMLLPLVTLLSSEACQLLCYLERVD